MMSPALDDLFLALEAKLDEADAICEAIAVASADRQRPTYVEATIRRVYADVIDAEAGCD